MTRGKKPVRALLSASWYSVPRPQSDAAVAAAAPENMRTLLARSTDAKPSMSTHGGPVAWWYRLCRNKSQSGATNQGAARRAWVDHATVACKGQARMKTLEIVARGLR